MEVQECSYLAKDILCRYVSGTIHSIFRDSFNFQCGPRFVHVSTERLGRVPFGLVLNSESMEVLLSKLKIGDQILWHIDTQELVFSETGILLSFSKALQYSGKIQYMGLNVSDANLNTMMSFLFSCEKQCGLGISIQEALEPQYNIPGNGNQLYGLVFCDMNRDVKAIEQTIRYLTGRGMGLTPAGDDLMVGFLAASVCSGNTSGLFKSVLTSLLEKEGPLLTTRISLEFLLYALIDRFASRLSNACRALFLGNPQDVFTAALEMLQIGNTSGLDTLIGVAIKCISLRRSSHAYRSCSFWRQCPSEDWAERNNSRAGSKCSRHC